MNELKSLSYLSPVWSRGSDLVAVRGTGSYLFNQEGDAYLDFTSGIGVTNTGHCHPKIVKAIQEQAANLLHGQANIVWHPSLLALVQELRTIVPDKLDGYFFSNSGAEAVEGAVKLARAATGRTNIIVFQGSFHGRTVGTMSLTTSKTIYRAGYQPLMPGVFVAPYPYAFRYGWEEEQTSQWCLDELRFLLITQTAPYETAAMLVEPVLGEGGYVSPPASFLKGLREICDEHGILLIADEIQSGFGRTGYWFAHEHFGITPDILVIAKGLASGLPLSGVIAPLELMSRWTPGSHGGTYGGNPLATAAAVATIQVIRDENLLRNCCSRSIQLMAELRRLSKQYPVMADLRGLGLMIGVEIRNDQGIPDKGLTKAITKACFEKRFLLLTCGPWDNTIRWIPPINVSEEEIEIGCAIFAEAVDSVCKSSGD